MFQKLRVYLQIVSEKILVESCSGTFVQPRRGWPALDRNPSLVPVLEEITKLGLRARFGFRTSGFRLTQNFRDNFRTIFRFSLITLFLSVVTLALVTNVDAKPYLVEAERMDGLVDMRTLDPGIVIEMRYATDNNFTKTQVYDKAIPLVRQETAKKLVAVNKELRRKGFLLKIWDAYRPFSVQQKFWELVPDDRYVANPNQGASRHNRGGAVDVTLVDLNGKDILMPSDYDDFSEKASPKFPFVEAQARLHADVLARAMENNGFKQNEHEWWHFDDVQWDNYPVLDVGFEEFLKRGENKIDRIPAVLKNLDREVEQALIVEPAPSGKSAAKLTTWNKIGTQWFAAFAPMAAVVGREGLAREGEKKEGDGRTPSGIFSLGTGFGYDPAPKKMGLAYRQVTSDDYWVDDPESAQYNQWVKGKPQAKSFEKLKRDDHLYQLAIVVNYNVQPVVPGAGSAIFIHLWRAPSQGTAGCVALSESNMRKLYRWLNSAKAPVVIVGESF